ncbi:MAG: TonB-dependent receptor [Marinicaulis sp.]|nr:TonB-dependent receptor [Marinicaulis sp.]
MVNYNNKNMRLAAVSIAALMAFQPVATALATPAPVTLKDRPLKDYVNYKDAAPSDIRPHEDFDDNYSTNMSDGLFFTPGVLINAHDFNEHRIHQRGFGLASRQGRGGIQIYRDGAPVTDVFGVTNAMEIDLLSAERLEVLRPGRGDTRLSAGRLGGAVNIVSRTGDREHGLTARAEGGASREADAAGRIHASVAGQSPSGGYDYYASLSGQYETGARDNNRKNSQLFHANLGFHLGANASTRFFIDAANAETELAGGQTPAALAADPTEPMAPITLGPLFPGGPIIQLADGARDDDFARDLISGRLSNQTKFRLLGLDWNFGGHYTRRSLESSQIDFIGIIDEEAREWGGNLTAARNFQFGTMDASWRLGGAYATGKQDSDRYDNLGGAVGSQNVDTEQRSKNLSAFIDFVLEPFKALVVHAGGKFLVTDHEMTDFEDDGEEDQRFTGYTVGGGAIFNFAKTVQAFANVNRTYEPPSFSQLIAENPEDFDDLDEQDAFTYEAGLRGRSGDLFAWDLTVFRTNVEGEIINVEEPETNGLGHLVNTDQTRHQGVELGLDVNLLAGRDGASLWLRNAYALNNFTFIDSGGLGVDDNRLAGVPTHLYRGELRYDSNGDWYVGVNGSIAGGEFYADHENVVSVPTYAVFGVTAGFALNDQIEVFAVGENITDQDYVAGVTPVLSQTTSGGRIYTPGNPATIYGGLKYKF